MPDRRARLVVILHADVAGSTALVQRNEAVAHDRIRDAFVRFSKIIRAYGGTPHEVRGDALLAEFSRVSDTIAASLSFQSENAEHNSKLDTDIRPELRVGISLGEVVVADGTLTGPDVVLAQRLEQLADPGSVCISGTARQATPARLPFTFTDLGKHNAKGFSEPVQAYVVELAANAALPSPGTKPESHGRVKRLLPAVLVSAVALIVLVAVAWFVLREDPGSGGDGASRESLADRVSVAVLPFENLSKEKEQGYFADGLTDDLITDLSKISDLFVIARHSSFSLKTQGVAISEVARELGVRYVVHGSVRRSSGRVRVNATLVDSRSDRQLWAERYDRKITDFFAMQDDLVTEIASALAVKLSRRGASVQAAPKFHAYELYLQARNAFFSGHDTRIRESLDLYEEAAKTDPSFAKAYSGYARAAAHVFLLRASRILNHAQARDKAKAAARKALTLDPTLAEAYSVLALLDLSASEHERALEQAQRAVDLEPNSSEAHAALCVVLNYMGRPEAALAAIRTAVRLDPNPSLYTRTYLGLTLYLNGQLEQAIQALKPIEEAQQDATADWPREILAMAYSELGRFDQARFQVDRMLEHFPSANLELFATRYLHHARPGDVKRRLKALEKAGMPRWPYDFQGKPSDKLDASAIESIVFGHTWKGTYLNERGELTPFVAEFSADGSAAMATPISLNSGKVFIDESNLCLELSGVMMERPSCGPVYRNTGDFGAKGDFVQVSALVVRIFSVTR